MIARMISRLSCNSWEKLMIINIYIDMIYKADSKTLIHFSRLFNLFTAFVLYLLLSLIISLALFIFKTINFY